MSAAPTFWSFSGVIRHGFRPIRDSNVPAVINTGGSKTARPDCSTKFADFLRARPYGLRTEQAYFYRIRRHICLAGFMHPRELDGATMEGV